jgi:hypothetical protein
MKKKKGLAFEASKASEPPFNAFDAFDSSPLSKKKPDPITLDDVLAVFPDARIVSWPPPIPAGHQPLLDAARAVEFPWLRLRPGFAIAGTEDSWRAWLEGFASPADLLLARRLLSEGHGLVTRAAGDDVRPPWALVDYYTAEPPAVPCPTCTTAQTTAFETNVGIESERTFTTGPWQTCFRCGGHEWRVTASGDVCVACGPPPGHAPVAATWVRAGDGWTCSRCHPAPPVDLRPVCRYCRGKGACRDHAAEARQREERRQQRAQRRAQKTNDPASHRPAAGKESAPAVPHLHRHHCPGGEHGVRRARGCPRTFACTLPACEQRTAYPCACCRLEVIEKRSKRQRFAAALSQLRSAR